VGLLIVTVSGLYSYHLSLNYFNKVFSLYVQKAMSPTCHTSLNQIKYFFLQTSFPLLCIAQFLPKEHAPVDWTESPRNDLTF
jgi:hypothetical protein